MKVKCLKFPAMILAIGLVAALAACLLSCISKRPVITEHDFRYSATYKLCGETKTIEGIYRCRYHLPEKKLASVERYYEGLFLTDPSEKMTGTHTIAQKDNLELCVVFIFADDYLMGDGDRGDVYSDVIPEPYLAVYDKEGYEYHDPQMLDQFDAQLLSWETPQPIENTFVFNGFSLLHDVSMAVMLAVGLLTIIAMMIVVKRDKTVPYKVLDQISVVFNYLVCFLGIPFFTLSALLLQLTMSGEEFIYQVYLCIPALTAFTVAASIALRREGFAKTGLFIQLTGPVLFFVPVALEPIFYNIFE